MAVSGTREDRSHSETLSSESTAGERPSRVWLRVKRNHLAIGGAIAILIFITIALLAPILPLQPPNEQNLIDRLTAIGSSGYLLGTDQLGRDLLSRLVWGARVSLLAGFSATALAAAIGITLGQLAGYFGGSTDNLIMRVTDMVMAFPTILFALAIIAVLGPGLTNAVIAIGIAGYPYYARIVRSSTLTVKELDYVLAARAVGSSHARIMGKHVFPNVLTPILVVASLDVGNKIILTAGLSFLGLGSQPPIADWGTMLANGRDLLTIAPHVATLPGLAIFFVVLSFNLIGDGLRDVFDPRTEQ